MARRHSIKVLFLLLLLRRRRLLLLLSLLLTLRRLALCHALTNTHVSASGASRGCLCSSGRGDVTRRTAVHKVSGTCRRSVEPGAAFQRATFPGCAGLLGWPVGLEVWRSGVGRGGCLVLALSRAGSGRRWSITPWSLRSDYPGAGNVPLFHPGSGGAAAAGWKSGDWSHPGGQAAWKEEAGRARGEGRKWVGGWVGWSCREEEE